MIKILDNNYKRKATLKKAINPLRFEEINGENTLDFSAVLDEKVSNYVNENTVIELDNDYFDIAYFKKNQNRDGTLTVDVQAEHISYRLNNPEYDMDYFTYIGTPTYILGRILEGTGFTVGVVEFTSNVTYSAQEKKSRRQILMEFVYLLGGELDFNKFTVNILKHRGNTEPTLLAKGKNVKVVSKIYNKRETDEQGNPLISYICEPIQLPYKPLNLGDEVLLVQKDLGIKEQLRIVRIGYNSYNNIEAEIELANFISGLEDDIYRIETTTVAKEKVYNGCRIGPDEGFVAERSDLKAKTIMNATEGISIYSDIGEGLERNFYVDMDGRIKGRALDIAGDATFQGSITASTIDIGNGNFTVDIAGNMVAMNGVFYGDIIGGSITSDTYINITTDAYLGNNLYLGSEGDSSIVMSGTASIDFDSSGGSMTISALSYVQVSNWYFADSIVNGFCDLDMNGNDITDVGNMYTKSQVESAISSAIASHVSSYHLM